MDESVLAELALKTFLFTLCESCRGADSSWLCTLIGIQKQHLERESKRIPVVLSSSSRGVSQIGKALLFRPLVDRSP
jgi:hypothetical protein